MVCAPLCIPWQAPEYCTEWNSLLLKPVHMLHWSLLVALLSKSFKCFAIWSRQASSLKWPYVSLPSCQLCWVCVCFFVCLPSRSQGCYVCSGSSLWGYAGLRYMFIVAVMTQASTAWSPPLCSILHPLRSVLKDCTSYNVFLKVPAKTKNASLTTCHIIFVLLCYLHQFKGSSSHS